MKTLLPVFILTQTFSNYMWDKLKNYSRDRLIKKIKRDNNVEY